MSLKNQKTRIAVVGGGLAGLGLLWHLLKRGKEVDLFEPSLGAGASGASTGILQPYLARLANRSQRADEALQETSLLLEAASEALGRSVALETGVLRLALSEEQKGAFRKRAAQFGQGPNPALFLEKEEAESRFPGIIPTEALWIPEGKTVFSRLYLEGLWRACEKRGARLFAKQVMDLEELEGYDRILLTVGSEALHWKNTLPLKTRHGQALVCKLPNKLPCSLIGLGHLSLMEDPALCQLGSTYEGAFDEEKALSLQEQVGAFFPAAKEFEIVEVRSGIRMAPLQGYLPYIEEISPGTWIFSGLGSRGLLYHALYGKELAERICL